MKTKTTEMKYGIGYMEYTSHKNKIKVFKKLKEKNIDNCVLKEQKRKGNEKISE